MNLLETEAVMHLPASRYRTAQCEFNNVKSGGDDMDIRRKSAKWAIGSSAIVALALAGSCAPGGPSRGPGSNVTVSISFPANTDIVADDKTLAVRCVAAGDGTRTRPDGLGGLAFFPQNAGRATIAPLRGTAPPDPLTHNATFTPLPDPGSNRDVAISCQAWDLNFLDSTVFDSVLVTETVDPTIEPFVVTSTVPVPGQVGIPFDIQVTAKDNDDRASAGLDDMNLVTPNPLRTIGQPYEDFDGVYPGPPQTRGTRGPLSKTHNYHVVCDAAGNGTFYVTVKDAAGNATTRSQPIECYN